MDLEAEIRELRAETLAYSALFGTFFALLRQTGPEMQALVSQTLKQSVGLCELVAQASGPGEAARNGVLAADKIEQIRLIAEPGPQKPRHGV